MSDRYGTLTVSLDAEYRSEDLKPIIEAIKQLRGVTGVAPIVSDHITDWSARNRVRSECIDGLMRVLNPQSYRLPAD